MLVLSGVIWSHSHVRLIDSIPIQGPIVHDLGAMPPADSAMSTERFEQLLDSIPSLRVMTISPRLEAEQHYQRIKALLKRYGTRTWILALKSQVRLCFFET